MSSQSKSKSKRKGKSKSKSPLNPNIVYQIAQHANVNGLGVLAGVNRTTRNMTKAEYDKRMPQTPLQHTKSQLIDKIWFILTEIYAGEDTAATEWPEDINEYFIIMGTFPEYSVNKRPYNAVYKFNSKRGYFEFMKRLSKEKVLGLYSWMNGRHLDYFRVQDWFGEDYQSQKRLLQRMAIILERPRALALRNGL